MNASLDLLEGSWSEEVTMFGYPPVTLMQGDCLELMAHIPDGSVDMVLADPPYGTTACKWDSVIPFEPMWAHLKRVTKRNAAIVMTASHPFTSLLVASNVRGFRHSWVYQKTRAANFLNANRGPLKYHEDVLVFSSGSPVYIPQMRKGEPYTKVTRCNNSKAGTMGQTTRKNGDVKTNAGDRHPSSVLDPISNPGGTVALHPTQKPVALMEYLIKTYTNEGDTVLDFTMGSGTTGVACKNTGRNFIGIELDRKYFQIAKQRIGA